MYKILHGNAATLLPNLNRHVDWLGDYVHCVVTSPPYFQKRVYGDDSSNEIGQEKEVDDFIDVLVSIFNDIPLHPRGSIWINIGDTRKDGGLLMVPERLALAMRKSGWSLMDNVIWAKVCDFDSGHSIGGCMPEPARNRLNSNGYEYVYRFVKDPSPWSDVSAVSLVRGNVSNVPYLPEEMMSVFSTLEGRSLHNVWQIPMGQTSKQHYAVYPPSLCERPIAMTCPIWVTSKEELVERIVEFQEYEESSGGDKRIFGKYNAVNDNDEYNAERSQKVTGRVDSGRTYTPRKPVHMGWSKKGLSKYEGGIVFDPFSGTGSTGEAAIKLGRRYIGIDLYEEFAKMSDERCVEAQIFLDNNNLNPRKIIEKAHGVYREEPPQPIKIQTQKKSSKSTNGIKEVDIFANSN